MLEILKWLRQVSICLGVSKRMSAEPSLHSCTLLLFVATTSEQDAVVAAAKSRGFTVRNASHELLGKYQRIEQNVGNERVFVVRALNMGPFGHRASADLALRYRWVTGATAIVQVGMAFGVFPSHQAIGDVLVSSSLIPYDNRNIVTDGCGSHIVDYSRAVPQPASPTLLAVFQREKARGKYTYGVHVGAILSGAAHISVAAYRDQLVSDLTSATFGNDPIVGGEMEAVGLLGAADVPIWCVVKGISDYADEARKDTIKEGRKKACVNAAEFVFNALVNDANRLSTGEHEKETGR